MANNHSEIEKRLWASADELRANSKLKPSEYSVPVLGLIFLRYADHKFTIAEKELAGKGTGRRAIGKEDYQAKGVMYLPPQARFSKLLNLPEGENIGKAINEAMKAVETENDELKGVLPKSYNKIENSTLVSLLKTFSQIPMNVEGDAFGKIYEYFLGNFARAEGQRGGEFFTPTSLVKLIVQIIEPYHGQHLRPGVRIGRHVRPVRRLHQGAQEQPQHRDFRVRPGTSGRNPAPVPDEPRRPRPVRRHSAGQQLLRRPPRKCRQVRLRDGQSAVQRRQSGQGENQRRPTLPLRDAQGRQRQLPVD